MDTGRSYPSTISEQNPTRRQNTIILNILERKEQGKAGLTRPNRARKTVQFPLRGHVGKQNTAPESPTHQRGR